MKKFIRYSIFTATAFIVIGAVILCITSLLGAPAQLMENLKTGNFMTNIVSFSGSDSGFPNNTEFDTNYPVLSGSQEATELGNSSTINKVDISLCSGMMYIKESQNEQIYIESADSSSYQAYVEGNTLKINAFKNIINPSNHYTNIITLYIPKDFMPETWDIDFAAGSLEIEHMNSSSNINIDVAAGELICHSLSTQNLNVDVGSASGEFSNAVAENVTASVGAGDFEYKGIINKQLDLDVAAGDAEFQLSDDYQNHNYDIDCALGDVTIGETEFSALAVEKHINNQSDSTYTLSCGMGNIEIEFIN